MTKDAMFTYWLMRVSALSADHRAEMSATLNSWKWPEVFSDKKPEGWDEMNFLDRYEVRTFQALIEAIENTTSYFDRSRAWWKYAIPEKSGMEHFMFYHQSYILGYPRPPAPLLLTA